MDKQSMNLNETFARLEEVISLLEREDISLEESFREYQKGMELVKQCNTFIDKVEKKVLMITEEGEKHEF